MRPEGLGKLKEFIHLIGSRTRDNPEYGISTNLPSTLALIYYLYQNETNQSIKAKILDYIHRSNFV
jgi:hypothetical protein